MYYNSQQMVTIIMIIIIVWKKQMKLDLWPRYRPWRFAMTLNLE